MAPASWIRGEARFIEEGGVFLALLGESVTGTLLGMVVDATHIRANLQPAATSTSVSRRIYNLAPEPPRGGAGDAGWLRLWSSEPLLCFCSFPFPQIYLGR